MSTGIRNAAVLGGGVWSHSFKQDPISKRTGARIIHRMAKPYVLDWFERRAIPR
jgi:hypothetical protein